MRKHPQTPRNTKGQTMTVAELKQNHALRDWCVYAIPTCGDPGHIVADRLTRTEAQIVRRECERTNDASCNYVARLR